MTPAETDRPDVDTLAATISNYVTGSVIRTPERQSDAVIALSDLAARARQAPDRADPDLLQAIAVQVERAEAAEADRDRLRELYELELERVRTAEGEAFRLARRVTELEQERDKATEKRNEALDERNEARAERDQLRTKLGAHTLMLNDERRWRAEAEAQLDALVAKTLAWEQTAVTGWGHRDAIQAECDCLRKALERIEHAANNDKPHGQIAYIARAALAGECR